VTWTYTAPGYTTAAELRDAVRLRIGDVDTNDKQLSDEEIVHIIGSGTTGSEADVLGWSIKCARLLVARFSRQVSTTRDGLSISLSDRAKAYQALLDSLVAEEAGIVESDDAAIVWAGGQSVSEKNAAAADSDAVQPTFSVGMDDNPNAGASSNTPFESQ